MKKAKQFLAMLLCLCMVIAVIPANAQASAAVGELTELSYNFKYTEAELKELNGGTTLELIQATDYSKTGRNWCFYNYPTDAWAGASTKWDGRLSFAGCGLQLRTEKENLWAAVELDVTQAADYNIVLDYAKYSSGSVSEIYMFPAPAEKSVAAVAACLTAANLKGAVNFADANNAGLGFNAKLGSINVDKAGKYLLVIRGTSADDGNFAFVSGLKLAPKGLYNFSLRTYTWDGSGAGFDNFDGGSWKLYSRSSNVQLFDAATWAVGQFKGFTNNGDYVAFELKDVISGEYIVSMDAQRSSASIAADFYIIPKCDVSKIIENCTDEYFIGNHNNYVNPSEAAPSAFTFEKKAQVAADGNYLLVAKRSSGNSGADRLQFTNVKLVRTGDAKPEGWLEYKYSLRTFTWGTDYATFDGGNWAYVGGSADTILQDAVSWTTPQFRGLKNIGTYLAFELKGVKAGAYDASMMAYLGMAGVAADFYIIPKCDAANIVSNCKQKYFIGNHNNYSNPNAAEATPFAFEKAAQIAEDGDYYLVAITTKVPRADSDDNRLQIFDFALERTGDYVAPAEPSNFGDHYAYMTKIGDKCVLTVIGGIKEIDGYSEVGFELSINGGAMSTKQGGANVYETINYEGAAIDTSKLGADVEYLFYETFEMSAADFAGVTSLKFKAYAEGEETEYGAEYELPLN